MFASFELQLPIKTAPGSIAIVLYTESPIKRAVEAIDKLSTVKEVDIINEFKNITKKDVFQIIFVSEIIVKLK